MPRSGGYVVGIASAVAMGLLSQVARGQSLPPDIVNCTRVHDSLERLECFDKAVARDANSPVPAATTAAPGSATAPSAAKPRKHLVARILSIRPFPDAVEVTLDNGQVWEQVQEASTELTLHPGESVTIDRQLGSYWLSDASGASIKVRERTDR